MDTFKTLLIRALVAVIVLSGAVAAVMFVRTATVQAVPLPRETARPLGVFPEAAAGRLADALSLDGFSALLEHLEAAFPGAHRLLGREVVGEGAVLYTWPGRDPSLAPVLLAGRLGRAEPLAMLDAVEALVAEGWTPGRTVLLAFGHDAAEGEGAGAIASHLAAEGVRAAWTLSAGGGVVSGGVPGVTAPIGAVGTAEMRETEVVLTAVDPAGLEAAVERLAEGLYPPRVRGPTRDLLRTLAPRMDPGTRMLSANLWLLERPLARALLAYHPVVARSLRSVAEPGGRQEVEAAPGGTAQARVVLRVAPWDDPEAAVERLRRVAAEAGAQAREARPPAEAGAPAKSASTESEGFAAVRRAAHAVFSDVIAVAPFLAPEPTDARHYAAVGGDLLRFSPHRAEDGALPPPGGADGSIAPAAYLDMVRFYAELLRPAAE